MADDRYIGLSVAWVITGWRGTIESVSNGLATVALDRGGEIVAPLGELAAL